MAQPNEITPAQAHALAAQGALIVDVREPAERESGVAPGAAFAPLSTLGAAPLDARPDQAVIFHCRGGARTKMNAEALQALAAGRDCYLMTGGFEAWRAAGLPVAPPR